jgi:hypothetical protein
MAVLAQAMLIAEAIARLVKAAEASLEGRREKLEEQLGGTFQDRWDLAQQVIDAMMGITETMASLD